MPQKSDIEITPHYLSLNIERAIETIREGASSSDRKPPLSLAHHDLQKQDSPTSKKVADIARSSRSLSDQEYTKQKKQEVDAFRLKSLLLLQREITDKFTLEEIINSIHHTAIETTPIEIPGSSLFQLQQVIFDFPGEEIETKGLFRRDSAFSNISIPVKESFQLTKTTYQSGFPHPLQYTGMTFSEILIPQNLAELPLIPELELLLKTKKEIAHQLLPKEKLNKKAKMLLNLRRRLFAEKPSLIALQKTHIKSLCQKTNPEIIDCFFESLQEHPDAFDVLSKIHKKITQITVEKPIAFLQQERLVKTTLDPSIVDPEQAYETYHSILKIQIEKMCKSLLADSGDLAKYQFAVGQTLATASQSIYMLQLSRQLKCTPQPLTLFEKNVLISLFRQQLVFIDELQNLPESISLDLFEEYLVEQIEEETAIFNNISSSDPHTQSARHITEALLDYYI